MLYDSTDRVKSFHSSLLLSDVLKEREKQIEYKELCETLKAKRDAVFIKEQTIARELAEHAEAKKTNYFISPSVLCVNWRFLLTLC